MNILYDNIIFELQKSGGISLYWSELIKRHIGNTAIQISFLETGLKASSNIFRKGLNLSTSQIIQSSSIFPQIIKRYLTIDHNHEVTVFHSSYYRNAMKKNEKDGCHIVTVHDFIYEHYVKGIKKNIHSWQKHKALTVADGIICVSESTKLDLLKIYPQFSEKQIRVIYNGVSAEYKELDSSIAYSYLQQFYKLNAPFILYVGARNTTYKNFDMAVKSIKVNKEYNLVLIGGGDLSLAEHAFLERELKNRYQHLQYIPQNDLNMFYNCAHCLLYPSSYEGFGLPLIEAQRAGCPIIAGNNSSIPEIVKNRLSLINIVSVENISQKIRALENSNYRHKVINEGLVHSKNFSWDYCYQQTLDFYKQVHERSFNILSR